MERVSVLLMMTQSGNIRISKTINTGTKEQLNSPGQGTHPPARGGLMRSLQRHCTNGVSTLVGNNLIIDFCFLENSSMGKRQHLQGRGLCHIHPEQTALQLLLSSVRFPSSIPASMSMALPEGRQGARHVS